jgi:antitoxin component of RelBE/YafQ-DinJ toxin-antitoxin module
MKPRDVKMVIRMRPDEMARVKKTAAEIGMTMSDFVRLTLSTEIARKTADPAAISALAEFFRQGVDEWVQTRVDHEIAKRKAQTKK